MMSTKSRPAIQHQFSIWATQALSPALLFFCVLSDAAFGQYQVGDTVVVTRDESFLTKDRLRTTRGQHLEVKDVNEGMLLVKKSKGWIDKKRVATPAEAIDIFTEQIRKHPQDAGAYLARAKVRSGRDEIDLAISDYSDALLIDPKNLDGLEDRAHLWGRKGDIDREVADYSKVLRLANGGACSTRAYVNRARAWNKKCEFDNAVDDATEAIRRLPRYFAPYSARAVAWAGKKEFEKALTDCNKSCNLFHGSSAYRNVAWFLATHPDAKYRDGKQALEFAEKGYIRAPLDDAKVADSLAAAYAETGDFKFAIHWQTIANGLYSEAEKAKWGHLLDLYRSGEPWRDVPKP